MRTLLILFASLILALGPGVAEARALTGVRDLVSTSQKSATSTHEITFTVTTAVPASGAIVLTPHAGAFSIPALFDYTDVDIAVSNGGPFVERDTAPTASGSEDGVSVITGSNGSITFTLNSTTGVSAGERVRIRLGTNATHGEVGDQLIAHPSTVGSYRMTITTRDASGGALDDAGTRIAIVNQVRMSTIITLFPPERLNGLPSGALSFNNATIELSLNTNKDGTCRYATSTGVAYGAMTGVFSFTGQQLHTVTIGGHANGTSYSYFVRCIGGDGAFNEDDYAISFSLEATPAINVSTGQTTGGTTAVPSGGGSGPFPSGVQQLYLATIAVSGFASPSSNVFVLVDGVRKATARANALGRFDALASNLERGAYTVSVYMVDNQGRTSASYTSTLSLQQGTTNSIQGIMVPPTAEVSALAVDPGTPVVVRGEAAPGATVTLTLTPQGGVLGDAQRFVATTSDGTAGTSGGWQVTVPTDGLSRGTYTARARAQFAGQSESNASKVVFLGIGEEPSPDLSARADINGDGKVNLIDFSILLSSWGRDDEATDLNLDGTTNLADFSILLFNWTG
jgi:hypothetical protein